MQVWQIILILWFIVAIMLIMNNFNRKK